MAEYTDRFYRERYRQGDLVYFQAELAETDLQIGVQKECFTPDLQAIAQDCIREARRPLESYLLRDRTFLSTLSPHEPKEDAPQIAKKMARAAAMAKVGPMAAVAGAIAEQVGIALAAYSPEVIIENGGDIYMQTSRIRQVGIFAGTSSLSNRVGLEIHPHHSPLGICTSSGKVGHSLSFGQADAVVVLSPSAPLADAVATACGNMVSSPADMDKAMDFAMGIQGVMGVVVIIEDKLGIQGDLHLVPLR